MADTITAQARDNVVGLLESLGLDVSMMVEPDGAWQITAASPDWSLNPGGCAGWAGD